MLGLLVTESWTKLERNSLVNGEYWLLGQIDQEFSYTATMVVVRVQVRGNNNQQQLFLASSILIA